MPHDLPLAVSILLAVGAVLLIVLLVVGTVSMVRDALNGCPFAMLWWLTGGLEAVGHVVVALAEFVGTVIGDVLTAIANSCGGGD